MKFARIHKASEPLWDGYPPKAWKRRSKAVVACNDSKVGVVLWTAGPHVRYEIEMCGNDLTDLGLDDAPVGVSVWTGKYFVSDSADPTEGSEPKGDFRSLSLDEWRAVSLGECPWDDNDWR